MPTPDRSLTRRELLILLAATLLYAAVAIPIGIPKGGDLATALGQSQRWIEGAALYDRTAYLGVWWPPFAVAALVPFALVAQASLAVAKGIFAALTAGCIAWSVGRAARAWGWAVALLALLAVGKPLQTNAEVLNINAMLLALLVATAADLRAGREQRAAVWIGLATALKAFPALFLLYFGVRRRWRALAVSALVAGALTGLSMLRYGVVEGATNVVNWLTLSLQVSVPPEARTSQSLEALVLRLGGASGLVLLVTLATVATAALTLRARKSDAWYEVGIVALVAVLISPIAWDHYYLLFFISWVALLVAPPPPRYGGAWRAARITAGVVTSGIVLAVVPTWLRWQLLLQSMYAWGAVLVLALLILSRAWAPREEATQQE